MGKDKLRRFAEIETFANVYQLEEGKPLKGNWAKEHFKNDNPVVLELACGKGEYTVNLAQLFPDKNFIGVDVKGSILEHYFRTKTLCEPHPYRVEGIGMDIIPGNLLFEYISKVTFFI